MMLFSFLLVIFSLKFSFSCSMLLNSFLTSSFSLVFWFSSISMLFLGVLLIISKMKYKFSIIYSKGDPLFWRFSCILFCFIFSSVMLMFLPFSPVNFLMAWDGLGLTSFLLISYYPASSSLSSSFKTFLIKRLGDGLMMVALFMFMGALKMLIMTDGNLTVSFFSIFILLLGLSTKSAFFPFSTWLPAASAAPTPVSALVHSSTLVTAGVFSLSSYAPLFPKVSNTLLLLFCLYTLGFASVLNSFQHDIKKIVALSTLSQLGFMGVALSLNLPNLAFFHLLTHASFKSLLFSLSGSFLLSGLHCQDIRLLSNVNPSFVVLQGLVMTLLSLSGFYGSSGYFSKDLILEKFFLYNKTIFYWLSFSSSIFTSLYSFRLVFYLLIHPIHNIHANFVNNNPNFSFPLFFFSILAGWFGFLYFFSFGLLLTPLKMGFMSVLFLSPFSFYSFYIFNSYFFFSSLNLEFLNSSIFLNLGSVGSKFSSVLDNYLLILPHKFTFSHFSLEIISKNIIYNRVPKIYSISWWLFLLVFICLIF